MFYSHEILTSPEYGVATIWLVATLGSKSVTRRLNRKTILDVDVPKACGAIIDPGAPMALRLQGNLLYGVSRVYSHQCGYTLMDVQAMHDKMRTMLRALPGGGLDPSAGKARPEQLILPYDPSFLPDSLPGLIMDLSKFTALTEVDRNAPTYFPWAKTTDLSQSVISQAASLHLSLSSDDGYAVGLGGFASDTDMAAYGTKSLASESIRPLPLDDEAGVILQADFEFDEDGNIVELGGTPQVEARVQNIAHSHHGQANELGTHAEDDIVMDDQLNMIEHGPETGERHEQTSRTAGHLPSRPTPFPNLLEDEQAVPEANEASMAQRQRVPKVILADDQIGLRNSELAHLNHNYVDLMAVASKQKRKNKIPTLSKKNGAFWVYGQGIGSVGNGIGKSHVTHPLHVFSGEQLYNTLTATADSLSPKRVHDSIEDEEQEHIGRRVRARTDDEPAGQMEYPNDNALWNEDVEVGRHAASALQDDSSFQMPWNVTTSIHSSRQGSTTRNIFPGIGSVSDFSSHGFSDMGLLRARSRLTSSSPLAGRGFPFDVEALDNLLIPGHELDDANMFEDFDVSQYLHTEIDADHDGVPRDNTVAPVVGESGHASASLRTHGDDSQRSTLDQESLNFLDFLTAKIEAWPYATEINGQGQVRPSSLEHSAIKRMHFSTLLPPAKTSRIVATQGLMHILALATKSLLTVSQDEPQYIGGEEYGELYLYGEIYLSLPNE
ncbi:Rad21/Rec8 N terminal domain protein [Aspergillus homomorphus CBS 101889]|uniref:Rad21/Rec8-like protein N-terminal domain-containing protein n=1 Tax=Aspergillus homomorphus (strain CBS 101889) TaxID=1450537 RepID=A0A395I7F8_ASPHC|nr:hypothetical protein BO97DRAFT_384187 [Aspergillus homomorphus CBS 101889]RAL16140.1 hypothetical protein BO97DRAFT_384187 [Aspergillus homomorphus CBS 101889]